jgi:hypothetical protein
MLDLRITNQGPTEGRKDGVAVASFHVVTSGNGYQLAAAF